MTALALTLLSDGSASANSFKDGAPEQTQTVDQDPMGLLQGLVVEEIRWPNISSDVDQKRMRDFVAQPIGQPLYRDLIRESIHRLYSTGRFADIRVEGERTPDGKVSLSFFTAPNYFVGDITVEGLPNRPTAGQVVNASKFQLGELFARDHMDRALASIQRLLKENG